MNVIILLIWGTHFIFPLPTLFRKGLNGTAQRHSLDLKTSLKCKTEQNTAQSWRTTDWILILRVWDIKKWNRSPSYRFLPEILAGDKNFLTIDYNCYNNQEIWIAKAFSETELLGNLLMFWIWQNSMEEQLLMAQIMIKLRFYLVFNNSTTETKKPNKPNSQTGCIWHQMCSFWMLMSFFHATHVKIEWRGIVSFNVYMQQQWRASSCCCGSQLP